MKYLLFDWLFRVTTCCFVSEILAHFLSIVSPGDQLLTKKPEDSGIEIALQRAQGNLIYKLYTILTFIYLFTFIDALSQKHSFMEKMLHSGASSISLFLRLADVFPDRCIIHIPASQRYERVPVSKRQPGRRRGRMWRRGPGDKFITMATGKGGQANFIFKQNTTAMT